MLKNYLIGINSLTTINFKTPVQQYLPQVEERMRDQSVGHHPDLKSAVEHLLASGGKRVRPILCLLAGEMLGSDLQRTINLAAAIEMLHTATLVHDDMIDGALLRRGNPTLNSKWSPAATILTGDFIFARAAKLAAETDSIEVMNLFAQTLSDIVNGEITQMFKSRGLVSRDDYFERIYAKTASMFELATVAPIYLSEGKDELSSIMKTFGYEIGMAFQIVDDILDFTGAQANVGKPVASDLRQGLVTLPALIYIEENPNDEDFMRALNGGNGDDALMTRLVSSIRERGAVEKSLSQAKKYVSRGLASLNELPMSEERKALEDLARYIVDRDF